MGFVSDRKKVQTYNNLIFQSGESFTRAGDKGRRSVFVCGGDAIFGLGRLAVSLLSQQQQLLSSRLPRVTVSSIFKAFT